MNRFYTLKEIPVKLRTKLVSRDSNKSRKKYSKFNAESGNKS